MSIITTRRERILNRANRAARKGRAGEWIILHMLAQEYRTIRDTGRRDEDED